MKMEHLASVTTGEQAQGERGATVSHPSTRPAVSSPEDLSVSGAGSLPTLPRSDFTLDDARARVSGWHFAKEALSRGEREILHVAEALLRLLDEEAGGYRRA